MLFAAGFDKRVSRGSQGVGNSLLIPQGDEERPRGEGKESPYLPEMEKAQGRDWRKARFFLLLFLVKKK